MARTLTWLACVCLGAVCPTLARAQFSLGVRADFAAGALPYGMALGDLNADGNADLVVSNQGSSTVSVLMGLGGGRFGAKTTFVTGSAPYAVSIVDLNADGKPDLVVVNANDASVSVLLGNGAGSFGAKTDFATAAGPNNTAIGDLNGDGRPDAVVSSYTTSSVSVLLGNGSGGFAPRTDFPTGTNCVAVALGDVSGDGKLDVVAANFNASSVSLLLGDGAGAFAAKTDFAVGTNPRYVSLGDVNADGALDLAVANQGAATVSVLLNNGLGGIGTKTDFATGTDPRWVGIGDLNGDTRPDLVVANYLSHSVSMLQGDGAGGFAAKTDFATGTNPEWGAVGDINGDHRLDVVTANYGSSNVSVLLAAPMLGQRIDLPVASAGGIAMAELNGDGLADIAVTNSGTNQASVCLASTSASGFGSWTTYATGSGPSAVALGEVSGDGYREMMVINSNDATISAYLNQGDGTFAPQTTSATRPGPTGITFEQFNTGTAPVVLNFGLSSASLIQPNGGGTLQSWDPTFTYSTGNGPKSLVSGDVDGDGWTDLVTGNGASVSVVNHPLLLPSTTTTFVPPAPAVAPYGVALGDLNGDGKLDLAATTQNRSVLVYLNQGAGFGTTPATYALSANTGAGFTTPFVVRMADLNGDGRLDIAVSTSGDSSGITVHRLTMFLGDGAGGFGPRIDRIGPFGASDFAVGDVNGDGRSDLAFPGARVVLTPSLTRTVLTAPAGPVPQGTSITLTATIQPTRIVPTAPTVGTVSFFDGTTFLGTSPVSWSASGSAPVLYTGTATHSQPMNRPGARSLSAVYSGDGRRAGSISPPRAVFVQLGPLDVPDGPPVAFGLERLPNPARGGRVSVRFTLPSDAPAALELFDLNGRRVVTRDVGTLGAGAHALDLASDSPITPGIYFVRLTQGANRAAARVAVLN